MRSRRRLVKFALRGVLTLTVFTAGWYIVVRLISPWTVVKLIQLEPQTASAVSQTQQFDTLRVGCYNIAHGRGGKLGTANWHGGSRDEKRNRLEQIADLLKTEQLDIVVLNEVDFSSFWSDHLDQSMVIARRAGYPYLVQQKNVDAAIPFMSVRFGNAILSKFPVTDTVFMDYPNPERLKNIFVGGIKDGVAATVALPDGGKLHVAAVHLSLDGEAVRTTSVEMMMEIHRRYKIPMLAMGDFNSTAEGLPDHQTTNGVNCIDTIMADEDFETLPKGPPPNPNDFTFPSEKPVRIIDWIFVSSGWHVAEKNVIQSDLSDHLPVIAVLKKSATE